MCFATVNPSIGTEPQQRYKGDYMGNGTMGKALHPKLVKRVHELLRKSDLTIPMISARTGVSASQVRNIKYNRSSDNTKRHPKQDEFDSVFGDDSFDLPPPIDAKPPKAIEAERRKPPSADHNIFDDASDKPIELRSLTPELERKIIADFRGEMPLAMIAKKHRVPLAEIDLLTERVYWLSYVEDPNTVMPCRLSVADYRQAVGPRLSAAQMKLLGPHFDWIHGLIMETLFVDLATAETIGKVVMKHHLDKGLQLPPKQTASEVDELIEQVISELFAEMIEPSDDLEPLTSLCLRFFHREPDEFTIDAWIHGKNDLQQKLETFEVDGQLMTTEKHFREFFRCFNRS